MKNYLFILLATIQLLGCSAEDVTGTNTKTQAAEPESYADSLYLNARIYTVDANDSWAEAMAVRNGTVVGIGSADDLSALTGPNTKKLDMGGRMIMPGIHDTHIHPADAGISKTLECSFLSNDLNEVLDTLRGCIAQAKPGEWVRGGQWNEGYFAGNQKLPKTILDEIAPDNPVFLMDWSVHHAWVNSQALELFSIDNQTPDPEGGVIKRDSKTGEAIGLLYDNAAYSKRRLLPKYSTKQNADALLWSLEQISQYGITTFKDAIVTDENMAAYQLLHKSDQLPLRVKTNLSWKSEWAYSHDAEKNLIATSSEYKQSMIDPGFVKIMLDGVPMTYTSALLEPYEANDVVGANHTGKLMIPVEELTQDVVKLHQQGLSIKIHATGDAAARAALDAFEAARKSDGNYDLIHEVSHAEMIHPDDVARFKELNVAAEMCPILWYPIPGLTWETWFGKDRIPAWQVKTLHDAGALVSYGSDWPVVPTPNPWPGIEAMVTRSDPYQSELVPEFADEAVELSVAVRIFTHNSAIANRVGESSGSLEVGKDADFIVLDQNIFEIPIAQVGDTMVLMSVVNGQVVFDNTAMASADEKAVADVINQYISGTRSGNVDLLKSIFHPDARMVGHMGPDLLTGGPEPFFNALAAKPLTAEEGLVYHADMRDLEVNGRIARVTLAEEGFMGMNFVNHFLLIKSEGDWLISSKSFAVL